MDDGLTLFDYMRAREHRNYLSNLKDDIEEIKCDDGLSMFRISASTPTRKGDGMLVLDSEKSDYDWLLTPPGTPLFPSLDQETMVTEFVERQAMAHVASASKCSHTSNEKGSSSRMHSRNSSPHRLNTTLKCSTMGIYVPSPHRAYSASPGPHTTSRKLFTHSSPRRASSASPARLPISGAPSRSPSPSPSLSSSVRCRPMTPTRSPATSSRSLSTSSTPILCRNNSSPSSASRPRLWSSQGRSCSPQLSPWEPPVMSVFSTELPPNLRTSPSRRPFQRTSSEVAQQGLSTKSNSSPMGREANGILPQGSTVLRKASKPSKVSPLHGNSARGRYISPSTRHTQSVTDSKEMISTFASGKLVPHRSNLQLMFRPLMSSAPPSSSTRAGFEPSCISSIIMTPNSEQKVNQYQDGQCKDCLHEWSAVEHHIIQQNGGSLSHTPVSHLGKASHCSGTAVETRPREAQGSENAWDQGLIPHGHGSGGNPINLSPKNSTTSVALSFETQANPKDVSCGTWGDTQEGSKSSLPAHSRYFAEQVETSLEDIKLPVAMCKAWSSLTQELNRGHGLSLPGQSIKRGATRTEMQPVRRHLYTKNMDTTYGMRRMRKGDSFDMSTSDSFSCSGSLDSSYIDNYTEKLSEDLSEVDSLSHARYSFSNSSMTSYPFYNPRSAIEVDNDRLTCTDGVLCKGAVHPASIDKPHLKPPLGVPDNRPTINMHRDKAGHVMDTTSSNIPVSERDATCAYKQDPRVVNKVIEPMIVKGEQGRPQPVLNRNVTLEEAADIILFCNSIVHEVVYEAATLAEDESAHCCETGDHGLTATAECGNILLPAWRPSNIGSQTGQRAQSKPQQTVIDQGQSSSVRNGGQQCNNNAPTTSNGAEKVHQKRSKKVGCQCRSCCVM